MKTPPTSLYIHFPWCVQKCPYCDFNSHPIHSEIPSKEYIKKLIFDIDSHKELFQERQIQSIFLGGGTPSAFPSRDMEFLFKYIFKYLNLKPQAEITLEANPGSIERNHFKIYKNMGINRISIGAQSFQNDKLRALGRIHDDKHIYKAIDEITSSGFQNFNIDIMHGLPKQTKKDAMYDLMEAIKLQPTHISWYQLTLEPKTVFFNNPPKLPHEDTLLDIETAGKEMLETFLYKQYEVSAYSTNTTNQSAHNMNYWEFGDYIGIGAGAHSKITNTKSNIISRISKHRSPRRYLSENSIVDSYEKVTKESLIYEFMINALRLKNGFTKELFESRTGLKYIDISNKITEAQEKYLILINQQGIIKPSQKGEIFLNNLITIFS
jgi:putative oxygen-independent coproporphyrinogen III oxidase